jgi:hypothetical protein
MVGAAKKALIGLRGEKPLGSTGFASGVNALQAKTLYNLPLKSSAAKF